MQRIVSTSSNRRYRFILLKATAGVRGNASTSVPPPHVGATTRRASSMETTRVMSFCGASVCGRMCPPCAGQDGELEPGPEDRPSAPKARERHADRVGRALRRVQGTPRRPDRSPSKRFGDSSTRHALRAPDRPGRRLESARDDVPNERARSLRSDRTLSHGGLVRTKLVVGLGMIDLRKRVLVAEILLRPEQLQGREARPRAPGRRLASKSAAGQSPIGKGSYSKLRSRKDSISGTTTRSRSFNLEHGCVTYHET